MKTSSKPCLAKIDEHTWLHVCFRTYDVRSILGDWEGDYPGDREDFVKRRYEMNGDLYDVVAQSRGK